MKQISVEAAKSMVAAGAGLASKQRAELADQRLRALVAYARENSPFFREKYADLPSDYSLKDLPITNKAELQEHFDAWTTDPAVTFDGLTRHIRGEAASGTQSLFLGQYTAIETSGSTGVPFVMLRDEYHNRIHGALVEQRLMGRSGDAFSPLNNRIAAVIVTRPGVSSYSSFLRMQRAAGRYGENMLALGTSRPMEEIVEQLNAFAPTALTGYPSAMTALAREQSEGRLHLSLKCIASSAEALLPKSFDYITRVFGCPVVNNYCMTEGGEIAMSDGSCPQLHLNDDWVLVEPVDEDGLPAPAGTYSDGALITDLSNYICPIIRYRVSDRIQIDRTPCDCGNSLPVMRISGRVLAFFTLCGKTFFPYGLTEGLATLDGVADFQLARVEKDTLEIRLCVDEKDDFAKVSERVEAVAQKQLALCGIVGAKLQISRKMGGNSEKTGKRLEVVDEVKENV